MPSQLFIFTFPEKKNFIYISYGNLQSTRLGFFCCTNTCAPMVSSYYLMFLIDARLKFSVKTMPLSLLIILKALRESKREMANATTGIEKEIGALQLEEKKLVAEIKRTAKTGNHGPTKILGGQLIRLRQQIANLQGSRA